MSAVVLTWVVSAGASVGGQTAECAAIATLYQLSRKGIIDKTVVAQAIKDLDVDPEKIHAVIL